MGKPISILPLGTALARYVSALIQGKGFYDNSATIAQRLYASTPEVELTLKAAVTAMDLSSNLAKYGIAKQYLELLTGVSAVERLLPRMFKTDFNTPTPVITANPTPQWVAENRGFPVLKATLSNVTLQMLSMGLICVITKELAMNSAPDAQGAITRIMVNSMAKFVDQQFLTSGITGVTDRNAAAITNVAIPRVSTGSTSTAIAADLSFMIASLVTWTDPVWVMRAATLAYLWAHNTDTILVRDGGTSYLLGLPVFVSEGSPQQITLIDLAHIVYADKGIEIDVNDETTVEMASDPATGTASPVTDIVDLKSFFQYNLAGVRVVRWLSYARGATGCVVYMPVAY